MYRVHDRVHGRVQVMDGPCTAVYMVRTRPCTWAVKTAVYTVHGPCTAMYTVRTRSGTGRVPGRVCFATYRLRRRPCSGHGRTMCVARVRPCTQFVHGRGRPRAAVHSLYTAAHCRVQTVYTAMHGPCTWSVRDRVHGRVHSASTAVYRVHLHGRVLCTRPCLRPCTQSVHGRGRPRAAVHSLYTAAHCRVQTVYTAVHGPCRWSVRDRVHGRVHSASTAVYRVHLHGRVLCTRPCLRPCTQSVHGRGRPRAAVHSLYTAAHCRVQTVYTAVHGPCRWSVRDRVHGRVHSASTAVYRVHLHGRVLCTRPCLRPCTQSVHGRVQTVYTAVHGPRTWSVRDPITAVYGRVYGPCARRCTYRARTPVRVRACTRPFTACTDRVHRRATAVYMVRPRPCTGYTYTVGYSVHGLVYGPCTRPLTAVYRLCTRPCTGHVHGPSVTRSRPCTGPVHGRVP